MEHPGSIGHQDHAKDVRLAPESVDQGVAPKYLHWAGIFGSFWWVKTRINHPELDGLYMFIPSGYIHLLRFYGSSSSLILGNQVGWMGRLLFRWPASSEILLPPAIHNMSGDSYRWQWLAMWKKTTKHWPPMKIHARFQGGSNFSCAQRRRFTDSGHPLWGPYEGGPEPISLGRMGRYTIDIRWPEDLIVRQFLHISMMNP